MGTSTSNLRGNSTANATTTTPANSGDFEADEVGGAEVLETSQVSGEDAWNVTTSLASSEDGDWSDADAQNGEDVENAVVVTTTWISSETVEESENAQDSSEA